MGIRLILVDRHGVVRDGGMISLYIIAKSLDADWAF